MFTHHYLTQVETSDDLIPMLVDSLNNHFVLSRPGDMTFAQEDHSLLHDLIFLFILCFLLGALFANTGVPSHLAYMIAGTILGPSGYNVVTVSTYSVYVFNINIFLSVCSAGRDSGGTRNNFNSFHCWP